MEELLRIQEQCCQHYEASPVGVSEDQLVVISSGVYEGNVEIEGVRYPSPKHMSGWWLTTHLYDGNLDSLKTVHFKHIASKRPDITMYMALPFGYRFLLGGESEHVWFDEDVYSDGV